MKEKQTKAVFMQGKLRKIGEGKDRKVHRTQHSHKTACKHFIFN